MSDTAQFLFRFTLFALIHSLCAIPSFKKNCAGRSTHLSQFYRLYYNLISLMLFGWTMAAFRNSAVLYVMPGIWSLVMYGLQMVFLVILGACVCQTGIAEFLGVPRKIHDNFQTPQLITNGWYRVVRHPLYLFTMLFLLSNPVISVRWLLLTLISAVYFLIGARLEEARLILEYGNEYLAYQRTVPFIIPRIFIPKA